MHFNDVDRLMANEVSDRKNSWSRQDIIDRDTESNPSWLLLLLLVPHSNWWVLTTSFILLVLFHSLFAFSCCPGSSYLAFLICLYLSMCVSGRRRVQQFFLSLVQHILLYEWNADDLFGTRKPIKVVSHKLHTLMCLYSNNKKHDVKKFRLIIQM